MRSEIPISILSQVGGYFDEGKIVLDIPEQWSLKAIQRQKRETSSETDFVYVTGPGREVNVLLKIHSAGDPLDHTPEQLFKAQKELLETEYWLRSYKGNFLDKPVQFAHDLKMTTLFRSLAHVDKRSVGAMKRMVSKITRKKAEEIWRTECFQLFRYQVTVLARGPMKDAVAVKADQETMIKSMNNALTAQATGRVVILKLKKC